MAGFGRLGTDFSVLLFSLFRPPKKIRPSSSQRSKNHCPQGGRERTIEETKMWRSQFPHSSLRPWQLSSLPRLLPIENAPTAAATAPLRPNDRRGPFETFSAASPIEVGREEKSFFFDGAFRISGMFAWRKTGKWEKRCLHDVIFFFCNSRLNPLRGRRPDRRR